MPKFVHLVPASFVFIFAVEDVYVYGAFVVEKRGRVSRGLVASLFSSVPPGPPYEKVDGTCPRDYQDLGSLSLVGKITMLQVSLNKFR